MKKDLLKAIKSLALFILILLIADRAIGYFIEKLYFKQKTGDLYQTTYAIQQAKQKVLIFGASRAMHQYVPDILEQKLHKSAYNLGRDGRNMIYHFAILSQVLTYNHPDLVILDVLPDEYSFKPGKEGEDGMISALLPYMNYPEIKADISQIRRSDIILSSVFKTYAYNSNLAQIFGYNLGVLTASKNNKGYEPLYGTKLTNADLKAPGLINMPETNEEEPKKYFKAFLDKAKQNNIKVCVVVSPVFPVIGVKNCISDMKKTTEEYGFKFYDFSKTNTFASYSLFYDQSHLNDEGAVHFTEDLVNTLTTR